MVTHKTHEPAHASQASAHSSAQSTTMLPRVCRLHMWA